MAHKVTAKPVSPTPLDLGLGGCWRREVTIFVIHNKLKVCCIFLTTAIRCYPNEFIEIPWTYSSWWTMMNHCGTVPFFQNGPPYATGLCAVCLLLSGWNGIQIPAVGTVPSTCYPLGIHYFSRCVHDFTVQLSICFGDFPANHATPFLNGTAAHGTQWLAKQLEVLKYKKMTPFKLPQIIHV